MSAEKYQLEAGGMVPLSAKLPKGEAVDTVVARAYRHPVLADRTVVRLTTTNVAAGDDLEMATLGFGPGEDRGRVAVERRRPLGFPGWALVHDPKNARYALDVVKELKKHARTAKSKPGHAKEGFDELAARLGKTVPQFLPSFFEEAGRVFIAHGAQSYAAAMFGKAREAEAVHALEVDEQHRVDAFLEFALAGAVTTKALAQYAKELGEHHAPAVAYAHFRQLCLQRTLGGMPPWAGMAKELRRLAKAAKLDPDAEDRAFVAEIIGSPALGKAAGEFWRAYAEPITALGKASPPARGALLNLFPTGSQYSPDLDDAWLDLLDAVGATDVLVGDGGAAEAQPTGGRAAWFDKLCAHLARDYRARSVGARAFALLRRMAPALIAGGTPITCADRWGQIDLDLVELALELGVPIAAPPGHPRINLAAWAQRAHEPGFGVDPVRAAAHPLTGPMLAAMVAQVIGSEPFDGASRGKAGFRAAKRAWLEEVMTRAETGALVALGDAIVIVTAKVKAETFADLPDLHARFAALDPAVALARSLRIGLLDELGWPALEEVALELNPDGKTLLALHGGPAAVIVASRTRAIAVGPTGRLGAHDLVIPPKHELVTLRWIGGQFLVVLKEGYRARGYWSSAPHDVFDTETSVWSITTLAARSAFAPDGAWLERERPIRAGDRVVPEGTRLSANDGATSWLTEWVDQKHRWREVSAAGERGRASWPAFIEAGVEADWTIDPAASYVLPMPGAEASPLGTRDGLAGARVRYQGKAVHVQTLREIVMIDGTTWRGRMPAATCLVALPGGGAPRLIAEEHAYREEMGTFLLDPDTLVSAAKIGRDERRYYAGQVGALPPLFWHRFTPRDEDGSRRLRAVTDGDARALLAAASDAAAAATLLPEVTHARLRDGVMGYARIAAKQLEDKDRLAAERDPAKAAATARAAPGPTDEVLRLALGGWVERMWGYEGSAWAQLEQTAAFFAAEDRSDRFQHELPHSQVEWLGLAVARSALATIALALGTPADQRKALAALLAQIARTLPPADQLRVYTAHGTVELPGEGRGYRMRWWNGNAYVTRTAGWQATPLTVLEYAPGGAFRPLPGLSHRTELRGSPSALGDAAAAELAAAIAAGTTSWRGDAAARIAAATGLTPSEAAFLWAGMPNANHTGANFLAKELREQMGLKATQAAVARDGLRAIPLEKRLAAIDEAGRAGVAALLDGSAVEVLGAAWTRIVGKKIAIPEELVGDADRALQAPLEPSQALALIGAAGDAPELTTDGCWGLAEDGNVVRVARPEPLVGQPPLATEDPVFSDRVMHTLAQYLPFLYAELPVGHALRAQAPVAHELALARLANRALWQCAGAQYLDAAAKLGAEKLLDTIGGEPIAVTSSNLRAVRIPGAILVLDASRLRLHFSTGELDVKAIATVGRLAATMSTWSYAPWRSFEYLRSPGLAEMMARIRETPVPSGGWEQNPAASVPKLVEKVTRKQKLSREAAVLYLQYLTLLWPTPKQLALFNGWTPKLLAAANAELLERELVLEAKRERAQRTLFLPGGWEALKSPHPPMETWKVALYGTRNAAGQPEPPVGRFLAIAPFHRLFEAAWQRIEDGDVPRYDEVER